jgi:hypothetical protein
MKVAAPETGAHLASTAGAVFVLKPNEVRDIPMSMAQAAYAAGCRPVSEDAPPVSDDKAKVREVIAQMVAKASPDDFTSAGRPKIALVRELSGVDVSVAESNAVFDEVMSEHGGS